MYFRCWLAITERGGAADDNSATLIAAPRDGFKRSCDKVANRVSFYINPVQRERRRRRRKKGERLYNLGRREGEAVFSLQTCYLEICPVYLRVCTRANSEFTIDLSRLRATGNKVGCGATDCHLFYSAKRVANCLSLSLLARFRAMASSPERRKSNLREEFREFWRIDNR